MEAQHEISGQLDGQYKILLASSNGKRLWAVLVIDEQDEACCLFRAENLDDDAETVLGDELSYCVDIYDSW